MTQATGGLTPAIPPETLYFGTDRAGATSALVKGLTPAEDGHVHLSADPAHARAGVATTVVFTVYARTAHDEGQAFWRTDGHTWLTGVLDPDFLYLPPVRGAE